MAIAFVFLLTRYHDPIGVFSTRRKALAYMRKHAEQHPALYNDVYHISKEPIDKKD